MYPYTTLLKGKEGNYEIWESGYFEYRKVVSGIGEDSCLDANFYFSPSFYI